MTEARRRVLAGLSVVLLWCPPAAMATDVSRSGSDGTLAVVLWSSPDFSSLLSIRDACWLITYSQDMAVFLLPRGFQAPGELKVQLVELEPVRREGGDYYLCPVDDASTARFEGETRVLARAVRTAVVWSANGRPRLTSESREIATGPRTPLRLTISPKVWPLIAVDADSLGRGAGLLEVEALKEGFDPLVDIVVAEVDQSQYVGKWQVLDDFETRYYNRPENESASQWIHDTLESYGLEVEYHTYSHDGVRRNVVGTLPGLVEPEKVVYMTAHFDSVNRTDDQAHAPGADDNASGVAAFLEVARILSRHEFSYTIKFVGFNSEEQGMIGSGAFVGDIPAGEEVVGCYNMDMLAYSGNHPGLSIYTDERSLPLAEIMAAACQKYVAEYLEPIIKVEPDPYSDHAPFLAAGHPALFIIEGAVNGFCPWYHTADDRIEQYSPEFPTNVTRAAAAAVAQTAIPFTTFDDCNENEVPDSLDIARGTSADCNGNAIPDECDIQDGLVGDVNGNGVPDPCEPGIFFRRGDTNVDGEVDLSDAVFTLRYLFLGVAGPACEKSADCDDNGILEITDAVRLLEFIFLGGLPPEEPYEACGLDATPDDLTCERYELCE